MSGAISGRSRSVCWGGAPTAAPPNLRFRKIALTTNGPSTLAFVCGLTEPDGRVECWPYDR